MSKKPPVKTLAMVLTCVFLFDCNGIGDPEGAAVGALVGVGRGDGDGPTPLGMGDGDGEGLEPVGSDVSMVTAAAVTEMWHVPVAMVTSA